MPLCLTLPILSPRISPEAVHLCIAALYSPAVLESHLSPSNSAACLATAAFLGLHHMEEHALELAQSVLARLSRPDEFATWERFLTPDLSLLPPSSLPLPPHHPLSNGHGELNGNADSHGHGHGNGNGTLSDAFEPYRVQMSLALRDRIPRLAKELGAFGREPGRTTSGSSQQQQQDVLAEVLAVLSFELFKASLESAEFPFPSDMDRCELLFLVLPC